MAALRLLELSALEHCSSSALPGPLSNVLVHVACYASRQRTCRSFSSAVSLMAASRSLGLMALERCFSLAFSASS